MRNLKFIPPGESGFIQAVADAARDGARRFRLPTGEPIAQALTRALTAQFPDVAIEDLSAVTSATDQVPVTVLCDTDGERLTAALMQFVDVPNAAIIAPVSNHHWSRRSLFLISIPKAGTHLLTELVRAFGYQEGGECPATDPLAGAWHFLEFTNSHTTAADFFIDSVRRAPHGNRFHPFPAHPALFIYRNPLDIVVSEASYYHRDGATAFTGYLRTLDDEERLLRLIDDKPLLGSIRDRVFKFSAWLDFCNVTPVSYEELVGPRGEGSASTQEDLVWSLMLKLHVPGNPADFAKQAYNPKSQTFSTGKIGSHRRRFTPAAWAKFQTLSNDFMEIFGYAHAPPDGPWLPSRATEFRRRIPEFSRSDPGDIAVVVRRNFLGHNIYRQGSRFYALPVGTRPSDTARPAVLLEANDQATVEYLVHSKMFLESPGIAPILAQATRPSRQ